MHSKAQDLACLIAFYTLLAKKFDFAPPPQNAGAPGSNPQKLEAWLSSIDDQLTAFHLRQYLHEESFDCQRDLLPILKRYLSNPDKNDASRDKVEVMLAYFFVNSLPQELYGHAVGL